MKLQKDIGNDGNWGYVTERGQKKTSLKRHKLWGNGMEQHSEQMEQQV